MTPSRAVLLAAVAATRVQVGHAWLALPARTASHFDLAGRADGWMARGSFLIFYVLCGGLVVGAMVGTAAWIRRSSSDLIHIPHKTWWLAPGRREATLDFVRDQMEWMAVGVMVFLGTMLEATILANRPGADALPMTLVWGSMGALLVWVGLCVWHLLRRFSRLPTGE